MKESVFLIQCSRFFAPSNLSGIGGMHHEHIHACPAWRKEHPHYDCIFVNTNLDLEGMRGMDVAWVLTFFSFTYRAETYPCAVVQWFNTLRELPDDNTSMWMVQPAHHANNAPHIAIIISKFRLFLFTTYSHFSPPSHASIEKLEPTYLSRSLYSFWAFRELFRLIFMNQLKMLISKAWYRQKKVE